MSFIFRGDEVVAEESQEDKIRYIRTSVLLASDAESARTYYHYASDEMSSITHVVDSEAGEILNHYEYDAWGNLTTCEEKVHNRFKFNGQQLDPVTQQYYLRARYYNPVIGRFTQEDTYRGDGLNLYAYCANNPVYYVDPSGHLICQNIANTIIDKLRNNQATRNEQKKLVAFLRAKSKHEELTDEEQKALNKIDGYTYLNRYEGQPYFKCPPEGYYQDSIGDWHRPKPDNGYASYAEVGIRRAKEKTYVVNGKIVTESQFEYMSRKAISQAWAQERELVRITGKGSRDWTDSEKKQLLRTGRVKGYDGHHMKSKRAHPDYVGDPNNIEFLKGDGMDINEHLNAHNGDYRNPTNGYYDPLSGVTIDFGDYYAQ